LFTGTLVDAARVYGRQWWRLALVQLLALVVMSAIVLVAALIVQSNSGDLLAWLVSDADALEARAARLGGLTVAAVAVLTLPVQLGAVIATVRIADRTIIGTRPRLLPVVAEASARLLAMFAALALAVVIVVVAIVAAPFFVFAGVLGLAASGVIALVRRRRAGALLAWPRWTFWALAAIPFAVAWRVAATAIFMPVAVVLEPTGAVKSTRVADRASAGRRWTVIGAFLAAVLVAVAVSVAATYLGSLLWDEAGAVLLGGVIQLVALPLPIVAAAALYRRAAGLDGRHLGAPAPSWSARRRAVASPLMARVAAVVVTTLVVSVGLAVGPTPVAQAAPAATVAGSSPSYVVRSAGDTVDPTELAAQSASCLASGPDCTVRAALGLAQQAAMDGAVAATVVFGGDLAVALAAPLTFAPDSLPGEETSPTGETGDESPAPTTPEATATSVVAGLLTIDGGGHGVTLDGGNSVQILDVRSEYWNLAVSDIDFTGGTAPSGYGGALLAGVPHTSIDASTFTGNSALFGAGAVFARDLTVTASSFIGNLASYWSDDTRGGAILTTGATSVENSTFGSNKVGDNAPRHTRHGDDIYANAALDVVNSTFVNYNGNAIANAGVASTVRNSIFTTDLQGSFACAGTFTGSNNVHGQRDTTCPGMPTGGTSNYTLVTGLSDGGRVPVYPLTAVGNPASGAGADCPSVDALGTARPAIGCDLGAVEFDGKTRIALDAVPSSTDFGAVTFRATVSASSGAIPNGTVTFTVNGVTSQPVSLVNSVAELPQTGLARGAVSYSAAFTPDGPPLAGSTSETAQYTVEPVAVSVALACADSAAPGCANATWSVGDTGSLGVVATVTDDRPGSFVIATDAEGTAVVAGPTAVAAGSAALTVAGSDLGMGSHTLYAVYTSDDEEHAGSTEARSILVLGTATATLARTAATGVYGDTAAGTATVTVSGAGAVPTGTVVVRGVSAPLDGTGTATFDLSQIEVGTTATSVTAQYSGDSAYAGATSNAVTYATTTAATSTQISTVAPTAPGFGEAVTVGVTVRSQSPSTADAQGTVQLLVDGTDTFGPVSWDPALSDNDGVQHFDVVIPAGELTTGTHTAVATFTPGHNFTGSASAAPGRAISVSAAATSTVLTVQPTPSAWGDQLVLTATVDATASGLVPAGSVRFSTASSTLGTAMLAPCAAPNTGGCAVASITVSSDTVGIGDLTVGADYLGTTAFAASTATAASIVVTKATPVARVSGASSARWGEQPNYSIHVGTATAAPADGTVVALTATLTAAPGEAIALGTVRLVNGAALFAVPTRLLSAHEFTITATFAGDDHFAAASGSTRLTVASVVTDIDIAELSTNRVVYGQSIPVTITVKSMTGTLAPEGDVVLSSFGVDLARVTLNASDNTSTAGVRTVTIPASFAPPVTGPGVSRISARFAPSTGFTESELLTGPFEERPTVTVLPTSAKVAVTMNAVLGKSLTAVATVGVAGNLPGVIPSGRVVFTVTKGWAGDGGTFTAPLVNGRAELPAGVIVGSAGPWVVGATYIDSATDPRYTVADGDDFALARATVDSATAVVYAGSAALLERGKPLVVEVVLGTAIPATGLVRLEAVGGSEYSAGVPVVDGRATITSELARTLSYGKHAFTVYYYGDASLLPTRSAEFTVTVTRAQTTLEIGTSNDVYELQPGIVGASVTYTARVATATGPATGIVLFYRDKIPLGQARLIDGVGTLTVSPDVAWQGNIVATFNPIDDVTEPNTQYFAHSWIVAPLDVTLSGPDEHAFGTVAAYTATVAYDLERFRFLPASSLPQGAPSGLVRLSDGRGAECTFLASSPDSSSAVATGECWLRFTDPGDRTITASFVGHLKYLGAGTASTTTTVTKGAPTVTLATPNVREWLGLGTLGVVWDVAGPTTGTVTIKLGDETVCTSTSVRGSCEVSLPRFGDASGDTLTLEYSGNAHWKPATAIKGGTIVACVPSTPASAPKARITLYPSPNCDNGTGYYTSTPIRASVVANAGYMITGVAEGSTAFPADAVSIFPDASSASVETRAVLRVVDGMATPFAISATTEARCVPVVLTISGIADDQTALDSVRFTPQAVCGSRSEVNDDNTVTAYFKVDSRPTISYEDTPADLHSTFYGWSNTTGTDRFARSTTFIVAPEQNKLEAAFGPICYTGLPIVVQPQGGTLTTTLPGKNCAEPKSGATGWVYGTKGTGELADTRVAGVTRTYFGAWAGDADRYTPTTEKTTYTTTSWKTVRAFSYPITDKSFTLAATFNKCLVLKTEVAGDRSAGVPGSVKVNTAANCPVGAGSGSGSEVWFTPKTTVSLSTKPTEEKRTRTSLYFLGWTGVPLDFVTRTHEDISFPLTEDVTAVAPYGTDSNCRFLKVSVVPAGALSLKTRYGLGTNACAGKGEDRYDQGLSGNGISFDATAATKDAEGAEIVYAWDTAEVGSGGGTQPTLGSVWSRSSSLSELFYGRSDVIAYACEFVQLGARVTGPEGQTTTAGVSNIGAGHAGLDGFIRTTDADCSTGADPRSGWGSYAWTVGTQLLPIVVANPAAYRFTGWADDAKGTGETPDAPVNLVGPGRTVTGDTFHYKITANFTAICYTLSLPYDADKIEVVTPPNCPGVDVGQHRYLGGTPVVLHGNDKGDSLFRYWKSGHDVVDSKDARWASVMMSSDKTVIANYTAKSVGERMTAVGTAIGDVLAVASKKIVGIVAATAAAYVKVLLAKVSLVASGIGYIAMGLEELGVHGAVIDGMKNASAMMNSMLEMLSAPMDCISAWAAGGSNTVIYAAQNLIGSAIVSGLSASAAKPAQPAASGASSLASLAAKAGELKAAAAPAITAATALNDAKKVYDIASSGSDVGLEMTAHDAWGSQASASVFGSCMAGKAAAMATSLDNVASNK